MRTPLFSPEILLQQLILLLTVGLAIGLVIAYLRWQNRLDSVRSLLIPIALFAFFGTLDTLITMSGTWDRPWHEGNPLLRRFLLWGGWWGQCIGTALWIISWSLFVDGLEVLRRRQKGAWASLFDWLRLLTFYALAVGHLDGFSSWADWPTWLIELFSTFDRFMWVKANWLMDISPFGSPLYTGLFFGSPFALIHYFIWARAVNSSSPPQENGA